MITIYCSLYITSLYFYIYLYIPIYTNFFVNLYIYTHTPLPTPTGLTPIDSALNGGYKELAAKIAYYSCVEMRAKVLYYCTVLWMLWVMSLWIILLLYSFILLAPSLILSLINHHSLRITCCYLHFRNYCLCVSEESWCMIHDAWCMLKYVQRDWYWDL